MVLYEDRCRNMIFFVRAVKESKEENISVDNILRKHVTQDIVVHLVTSCHVEEVR